MISVGVFMEEKNDEIFLIHWPKCLQDDWIGQSWQYCNDKYPVKGSIFMDKNGKYIYLYKETEPNRYFRYDLSKKSFSRVNIYKTTETKITPIKVVNLRKYFSRCKIYTKNPVFARIFCFLSSHHDYVRYHNPIRYIDAFNDENAQAIEEWYNAGIILSEVESIFKTACKSDVASGGCHWKNIDVRPKDFDKSVLKILKKIKNVNTDALREWEQYSVNELNIYQQLYDLSKKPEFENAFTYKDFHSEKSLFDFTSYSSRIARQRLIDVMNTYNLDPQAVCRFLNRLKRVEGCDISDLIDGYHYRDYLLMEKTLNNENISKIDKYPKNWLTTFRRTKRNFEDIKKSIDEIKFKEEMKKYIDLEYEDKDFCIILPQESSEIRSEGSQLRHCVASYVDRVVNGQTCIIFCRQKDNVEEPFVTIEVNKGRILQAYGYQDSKPTKKTLKFMLRWAKEKELSVHWRWEKDIKNIKGD